MVYEPLALDEIVATVSSWRPLIVGDEEAAFARRVVLACAPASASRARSLLWATSRLASFGVGIGLQASEEALLRTNVIERFVMVGLAGATSSRRRTVRSNLRFVARHVNASQFPPEMVPVGRLSSARPYRRGEIAAFFCLAATQPTTARQMRATGLICLGAGAGLVGADLRQVRGPDVAEVSGVLCVRVRGLRPRLVPVLRPYREILSQAAGFAGVGFVIGGVNPDRHNVTHRLVHSLSGGEDLSRLSVPRLRATFLAELLSGIGLPELLAAAGLRDSKALFDLVSYLPAPREARVVAVIGALGATQPL